MPPIPPELAAVTLTRHPAPVADAMRALLAADSVHEQRDRVVECFRASVRVTAIVALAARQGPRADTARDRELTALLATLGERGLTDGQWVAVLRCAVAGLGDRADPVARSLCTLLRGTGRRRFARATDELLQMRRKETVAHGPTGDNGEVAALLDRRLPALCALLSALTPLWTAISIAVPLDPIRGRQRALSLAGETPRQHRWQRIELGAAAPPYTPVLVDADARPLLRLAPWAQVLPLVDGSVEALWCIEGGGAHVWLPGAAVRRLGGQVPFAVPAEVAAVASPAPRRAWMRWLAGATSVATAVLAIAALGAGEPAIEVHAVAVPIAAAPASPPVRAASAARVREFEARRGASSELLLPGHRAWIGALAVSPDGAAAVSGDGDGALRVWSPPDSTHRSIPGHDGAVSSVAFSPDATWIGSAGIDGTVRLWNRSRAEGHVLRGHEGWVETLAFSADGTWLASGSRDRSVRLWRLESSGEPHLVRVLRGHRGAVTAVGFSADARLVLTASADATVRVWDRRSGRGRLLRGPRTAVIAAAFDLTGAVIAATRDGQVWSWDLATLRGRVVTTHGAELVAMAIGADGAILLGGKDGRVRRWTGTGAAELGTRASPVTALVPTAAGAIVGHADGAVVRYGSRAGGGDQLLAGHTRAVNAVAVTAAGILSGSAAGELRLWRASSGDVDRRHGDAAIAGLTAAGPGAVLAGGADGVALVRRDGSRPTPRDRAAVTALAGAGELVVTGDADGRLTASRGAAAVLDVRLAGAITWVGLTPDGAAVTALTADGELHRFDAEGARDERGCGPSEPVVAAAIAPGAGLTVATWDGAVRVCDARGTVIRALEAHGVVRDLAWSADGATLAAAGADGVVRVWRAGDTTPVRLRGHDDEVTRAIFTAAGELVTSSRDGTVRLWDVGGGAAAVLRGHTRGVTALVLCDGAIVSGDAGGTVIFWREEVPVR